MDKVLKALVDPRHRQLLDQLYADNGQNLGRLCEPLDVSRQYLNLLEEAGGVVTLR